MIHDTHLAAFVGCLSGLPTMRRNTSRHFSARSQPDQRPRLPVMEPVMEPAWRHKIGAAENQKSRRENSRIEKKLEERRETQPGLELKTWVWSPLPRTHCCGCVSAYKHSFKMVDAVTNQTFLLRSAQD